MSAWGPGPLENDDAADLLADLKDTPDLAVLEVALTVAVDADEYVEAPEGSKAVAAACVVAILRGGVIGGVTAEDVDGVDIDAQAASGLTQIAVASLDSVSSEDSELREQWEEVGAGEWLGTIAELRKSLTS